MQEKFAWTEERIEEKLMEILKATKQETFPTHSEMNNFFGNYQLSNAIRRHGGTRYWASKIGMEEKKCESTFGFDYERKCAGDIFNHCDLQSELCDVRYPYDLLVDGSVKVDAKVAIPFDNYGKSKYFSFNLEKPLQTCDVFVFYCIDNNEVRKVYIVPSCVLSGKTQFSIGILRSKYDQYLDRWDIISKYADFMRGCV